ncbi:MAG: radical SAM protein [Bacilli bacterium]
MAKNGTTMTHKMERKSVEIIVDKILKEMEKDRNKEISKLIDLSEKFYGDDYKKEDYERYRKMLENPDSRWMKIINSFLDYANPNVAKTFIMNFVYESLFYSTKQIRKNRVKYDCNIPWLILFDPTDACNMHCTGCWAGTYGHKHNLSFEDMDKIVTEGKELGIHFYMLTGGEPMVRKEDVFKLAEKHYDCEFSIYTNSSLIDEEVCKRIQKLGNIVFQLSIEGTEETNDGRRGAGHYQGVMKAMDLLKKYGILFGTSICYTRANIEAVTNDEFIQMLADKGAKFGFFFHYMPVGNNAVKELLPTPEQRKYMIKRIRELRDFEKYPDLTFFPMDFQNDGEYVGGCIAGGRNYFHINSAGDAEPCVFIHYSNANIHDKSILEILKSPLFMAYHDGQPFNENHLRPCPMLENPNILRDMVNKTGAHSTDLESPEKVEHLCEKCDEYAQNWKLEAEKIWSDSKNKVKEHNKGRYQNYSKEYKEKMGMK